MHAVDAYQEQERKRGASSVNLGTLYIIVTVPSRKKSQLNHRFFTASASEIREMSPGESVSPGRHASPAHELVTDVVCLEDE